MSRVLLSLTNAEGRVFEQRVLLSEHVLRMSGWTLRDVSTSLSHLSLLTELRLDDNAFVAVPSAVVSMPHLRKLDMSSNAITQIPAALCRSLTGLIELRLRDNAISAVPREIRCLQQLKVLSLTNNGIAWVPVEIDHIPRQCRVNINGNPCFLHINAAPDCPLLDVRQMLPEIFAATTRLAMIAGHATTLAIGLQDLELPALVTLEILDAAFPNAIPMHLKWALVTTVKHFRQRRQL